jgi:hypothetical protein
MLKNMNTLNWNDFQDVSQFLSAVEKHGIDNRTLSEVPYGPTAIWMLSMIRNEGQKFFESLVKSGSSWFMTTVALREAFASIERSQKAIA